MAELATDGERRSIVSRGVRLVFLWTEDRWSHSIDLGSSEALLARTIEGDSTRDDPSRVVSPTYQQLEFQERGPAVQALLVGQSGAHHFSAVFTVEELEGQTRVLIDVADRCRSKVEVLACTYWVDAVSGDLSEADRRRVGWSLPSGHLEFEASSPGSVQLAEAGRRATRVQAIARILAGSHTQRCLYQWTWRPRPAAG